MHSTQPSAEPSPYVGYAYAYPHKSAYRPLSPPVPLRDAWAGEPKDALFLYIHVPFCEMRCGYCNLFTAASPREDLVDAYLQALRRQANAVRDALGDMNIARFAIGGGTPTFLCAPQLEMLLDLAAGTFGADPKLLPASVEVSPRTADLAKLQLLRDRGVERISIGVQSFIDGEVAASGRAQRRTWVSDALDRIRHLGFPVLNIDLIYGLPGQTVETWLQSLQMALKHEPAELYLYPLYIRPLTGLRRCAADGFDDVRLACYRAGRDLLLDSGYTQSSMRMFRKGDGTSADGPAYCCQDDGMVGLGCGARSYTRSLHYSAEYAVGADGVREIIDAFAARPAEVFAVADFGILLDEEDQRRRWVIKTILRSEGLDLAAYRARFGTQPEEDVPELTQLLNEGLIARCGDWLRPTPRGLEQSDAIGPHLYSASVLRRMQSCELR